MAELKQGGKEKDSKRPNPRLGDIIEYDEELTRQLRRHIESATGCPNIIDWEEIKKLILLGADPNGLLGADSPPLIHAIEEGNIEACKFLLDNGADANFQMAHNGQTPLIFAACKIHGNVACAIFDMLFEHGADVSLRDSNGKDAIMWVAETRKLVAGSHMNRTERNALDYLVEIMLGKAFMRAFKECIKG